MVCDDYSGYKARFKLGQIIKVGYMAHAQRKFHELHVTGKSEIAEQALSLIQKLYAIKAEIGKIPMVVLNNAISTGNNII